MDKDILQRYFFVTSLFLVTVLIFFIFLPFLEVIILSTIFAVVLNPLYKKLSKWFGGHRGFSAFILILLFAIVIMVPVFFLAKTVLGESRSIYSQLTSGSEFDYINKINHLVEKPIQRFYPDFKFEVQAYASSGADLIASHFGSIVSSVFNMVTGTIS
jgi:predicted PurR-regulated permease PerM